MTQRGCQRSGSINWQTFGVQVASAAFERSRSNAALRESEAKYRTLFESIDEGFCVVEVLFDPAGTPCDHRILRANPAFERQTGIVNPEGKTASELVPGVEQFWNDLYAQVVRTGEPIRLEQRSDALDRWLDVLVSRVGDGATRRVAIVFTDISDRKRAEATLQQTAVELSRLARKFDAIAAAVPDFIYTFDLSGRFTYISQALLNLWQKSSVEAMGKNFFELDYPKALAARLQNQIQQVIETRQPLKDETPYTSAFGTRAYEYIFVPMFDATGTVEAVTGVTRDITDRKQAETILQQTSDELERQVQKFDATLSTITDSVFTFDREGQFLYANQVLLDLWGITAAEVIGKTMAALNYSPAVERQVLDDLRRVLETGENVKNEMPYINPAGVEGYFEYILSPVFASDRSVESVVGLSRDISDRKRAEAALQESEQRFRLMADAVPQIVWITNADGRVEFFNKQWSDYTGVPYEPTTAAAVAANFVHPDDGILTVEAFEQARRSGSIFSIEHCIRSAAGMYRWFLVRAEPDRDPQTGEIVRWFGASVDIHDRKQAEAALRQSESRFRLMVESAKDYAIFTLNLNNVVTGWNSGAERLLGYSEAEIIGRSGHIIFTPEDIEQGRSERELQLALTQGQAENERWHVRQDGNRFWGSGLVMPMQDEAGTTQGFVKIMQDKTAQRQSEAEREQLLQREQAAREEAERANRLKDEFLAVLSHELRSPLNPILGWSRLLQNRTLDEARRAEALKTIERNAKLQAQLIEDLLDISRIMQGKLSLTAAPVSLTFVITAAVETVRLAAEAKQIQIILDLPTIAPISGDAARLQQVVWNLLTNAVKFTPHSGQVTVELRQLKQVAQIRISDTGKGIQPQFLPHVFEYFRQEDGSTTRRFGGLGLGLAIVRQIVEMHGGTVWAESEGENQGAAFVVQLPTMPQAAMPAPEPDRTQADSQTPLDTLQILLVDDDTDTREFQAFLLQQNGATVTAVDSGLAALRALEQLTPDVIVSDVGMAAMDGYMLIQQIRSSPADQGNMIPAIALTAYAAELDQRKALQAGFQAHITKPVEPEVLVQAVVNLLQEKKANKR